MCSTDRLSDATTALRQLLTAPVVEMPPSRAMDEVVALRGIADLVEAAIADRVAVIHGRGDAAGRGAVSTQAWLRAEGRMPRAEAGRTVATAVGLRELPGVRDALADGQIGSAHARVLARTVTAWGADDAREAEPHLLEVARLVDPDRLGRIVEGFRRVTTPETSAEEAQRAYAARELFVSKPFAGTVNILGTLTAETYAALSAAMGPLVRKAGPDDTRTPAQRRHDALDELARMALDAGQLPQLAGERPHLSVVVALEVLEGRAGRSLAELEGAGYTTDQAVRRLGCDAMITRVVVDVVGVPLNLGRTTRTVSPAQRKALRVRDGGCRFPRCDVPHERTEGHHRVYWSAGGRTDLANLVSLCLRHHHFVHEGGWTVRDDGLGGFVFTDPDGRVVDDLHRHPRRVAEQLALQVAGPPVRAPDPWQPWWERMGLDPPEPPTGYPETGPLESPELTERPQPGLAPSGRQWIAAREPPVGAGVP